MNILKLILKVLQLILATTYQATLLQICLWRIHPLRGEFLLMTNPFLIDAGLFSSLLLDVMIPKLHFTTRLALAQFWFRNFLFEHRQVAAL